MISLARRVIRKIKQKLDDRDKQKLLETLKGKIGIEIGGPSHIFSSGLPIYTVIKNLDGCNFSTDTVWEGIIAEGLNYNYYQDKKGYQFICEASDLDQIESNKYDFLIASHCLEHCANVLSTVREWLRVIKKGGYILLILPDKQYTFDHNRPTTSFKHLLEDFERNVDESDLTHLEEILELHDLSLDTPAGDLNSFTKRSLDNFHNRCLHHHVFDYNLLDQVFSYFRIKKKFEMFIPPYHQIIVGIKR